jgi:hypothetical protein
MEARRGRRGGLLFFTSREDINRVNGSFAMAATGVASSLYPAETNRTQVRLVAHPMPGVADRTIGQHAAGIWGRSGVRWGEGVDARGRFAQYGFLWRCVYLAAEKA